MAESLAVQLAVPHGDPRDCGSPAALDATPWWRGLVVAVAGFALVSGLAWITVAWSVSHPPANRPAEATVRGVDELPLWVKGWGHWDAAWYDEISAHGYSYRPDVQSSVAFFPLYPALLRLGSGLVPGCRSLAFGAVLTAIAGLAAAALLFMWARRRMTSAAATTAVLLLAVYPYSFYLFGAVYADALLLACTLGAFVLLERGHLPLAVLAGIACSAARPVGILVVVALAVRCWELEGGRRRLTGARRAGRPAVVLCLGSSGFVVYAAYLRAAFGDPLAFATTQGAPGWDQAPGGHTWLKLAFFEELGRSLVSPAALGLLLQLTIAVAILAAVPAVVRRFGGAYGLLVGLVVALPLVASKDFQGLGRYVLPSFPVFCLAGEWLATRRRTRAMVLGIGLPVALLFTSWFAKGNYLS